MRHQTLAVFVGREGRNRRAKVEEQKSRINSRGSTIEDQESRIEEEKSVPVIRTRWVCHVTFVVTLVLGF